VKLPDMAWAMAGFVIWSAAFATIYGLHGIGCAYGWDAIPVGPSNLQRAVQVVAWLSFLPPHLMLALWLRRRRLRSEPGKSRRWMALVGETTAWAGLAATIVTFAPAATASVCV